MLQTATPAQSKRLKTTQTLLTLLGVPAADIQRKFDDPSNIAKLVYTPTTDPKLQGVCFTKQQKDLTVPFYLQDSQTGEPQSHYTDLICPNPTKADIPHKLDGLLIRINHNATTITAYGNAGLGYELNSAFLVPDGEHIPKSGTAKVNFAALMNMYLRGDLTKPIFTKPAQSLTRLLTIPQAREALKAFSTQKPHI